MDPWAHVEQLLAAQAGVVARRQVPPSCWPSIRWRLETGRWQRPHRGVAVAHSGKPTRDQLLWVALLAVPHGAALAGATAAEKAGLKGFERDTIRIAIAGGSAGPRLDGVRYQRCTNLADELAPARQPPRVRLPVALIDMASAARGPSGVHHLLASAAQQRLIRTSDLRAVVAGRPRLRHRSVILETLLDIEDGAQSLNEVAMLQLVARLGLPRPRLQIRAATALRRSRIDGGWPEYGVFFEIDGTGHFEVGKWADDADRHNEVALASLPGSVHLRWPGFVVRRQPERVAAQAQRALAKARSVAVGW